MKCISDAVQLYKVPNFSAMVGKVLKINWFRNKEYR